MRHAGFKDIDDVILNRLTKEDLLQCSEIKGLENLEAALSANKGVVLASGHFFANRLGKRLLSEIGFPVLSVRNNFPLRHPHVGRVASKYLKPFYVNFVNRVIEDYVLIQDKGCTLKILERLRRNGLIDIHVDARNSYHLIEHPFLGTKRLFPAGFLRIVYLTGAAVVPMLCTGNSCAFTIIFEEAVEFQESSDKETFMSGNLARLVAVLESQVMRYPDQWALWGYNL
jgi:lauroyl/myristoyl acyltransferase